MKPGCLEPGCCTGNLSTQSHPRIMRSTLGSSRSLLRRHECLERPSGKFNVLAESRQGSCDDSLTQNAALQFTFALPARLLLASFSIGFMLQVE